MSHFENKNMENRKMSVVIFSVVILGILMRLLLKYSEISLIISSIMFMIVMIIILFDKNFTKNYPFIPKSFVVISLVLITIISAIQFSKIFVINNAIMLILSDLVIALILFFIIKRNIKKYAFKSKIVLPLLLIVYFIFLVVLLFTSLKILS
jgi:hypothetical protein